ncbi:hypothetical protein K466DRAFT_666587 [Polyporus arcularius HHB13444]|uniref:Uncharacterized protein n=1 Tax=Polyporus arcularius HHB13444 TaxID=1314778 RepID=A0A5C3P0G9_9APHY|nr:hypothetical protein K466DRAFT_666587 [Polyporus arcularius HHB13444]
MNMAGDTVPLRPGKNWKPVHIPGRAACQAQLYSIQSHSKLPRGVPINRILIALVDTREKQMRLTYEKARKLTFPQGTKEGLKSAGYEILVPGSYVLLRDMWGSGKEEDDDIAMVVPALEVLAPFKEDMDKARDEALGDPKNRDLSKARLDERGEWKGGVRFEHSRLAVNIEGAERCYPLGQTYQAQRKLAGPAVGAKVTKGEVTRHHKLRQFVLKASTRAAIAALEASDPGLAKVQQRQADNINAPRLGDACNYAFRGVQMNLAATQKARAGSGSLRGEMGSFGLPHADDNDSPGAMTVLLANSHLADGVQPGYFLNVELGLAVELSGFVACCFSGLRQHGGYPPMDFTGNDPEPWSYRFVVVCYPPKQMVDGDTSLSLGALPKDRMFHMPPEMIHPKYDGKASSTNNATWITSGPHLTDDSAYLQWYYQAQCQQLAFFHRQVKAHSDMKLDLDALSKVFYYEDEGGRKTYPQPWRLRPEEANFPARAQAMKEWDEFKAKKAKFLPFMYRAGRTPAAVVVMPSADTDTGAHSDKGTSSKRKRASNESRDEQDVQPGSSKRQKNPTDEPAGIAKKSTSKQSAATPLTSAPKERQPPRPRNARRSSMEQVYIPAKEVQAAKQAARTESEGNEQGQAVNTYNLLSETGGNAVHDWTIHIDTPEYDMAVELMENIEDLYASDSDSISVSQFGEWHQQAEEEQMAEASTLVQSVPDSPHFQPVLDVFSLGSLLAEYNVIAGLASDLSKMPPRSVPPQAVEQFLRSFGEDDRTQPQFALQLTRMWSSHKARSATADAFDLTLAMERRDIMLASAMAWYWLTQECASSVLLYASYMQDDPSSLDGCELWLAQLTRDVYLKLFRRIPDRLVHPSHYFPNCPSAMSAAYISRQATDCTPSTVCVQTITLLRGWLNFPTTSELLSAYFVLHLLDICGGNLDVLLLRGVWRPYKQIKASVLDMRMQRCSSLRLSHLVPFTDALHNLPLADESSTERAVLYQISAAVERCTPYIPSFTNVSSAMSRMPGPYPLPDNNVPATSLRTGFYGAPSFESSLSPAPPDASSSSLLSTPRPQASALSSRPSSPTTSLPPSHTRESGLEALIEFFQDLLPLARGEHPVSAIQQLVASDTDYYLPFRNLAPTRRAVMGSTGPFHSANVRSPGAFPSCVISRALTFNTPAVKDDGNPTLFINEAAWDAFKAQHRFSEKDKASRKYFFNVTCYGSAQGTRHQGMKDVDVYFAAEKDWKKLLEDCGGKVPFLQFFRWAKQQVKRKDKKTQKLRAQARLPLIGVVASPTVEEVATVIHQNGKGSRTGLVETGQITSIHASREETIEALQVIMDHFEEMIDEEARKLVGWDAIMAEHLLCKYQRVVHDLADFKGKHM